jgi:5-methylcytosine-specific restriction endonuclease McrA
MTNDIIEELKLKRCSKCGEFKEICQFNKQQNGKYGVGSECKECRKIYRHEHYLKNKEKTKEQVIKYRLEHPVWYKRMQKEYRNSENGRINIKSSHDKYWHSERGIEVRKQKNKRYNASEKGKIRDANKHHKRRVQKQMTQLSERISLDQWTHIIKLQNNKCAMCGRKFSDDLKPTMDHIVPLSKGGMHNSVNIQALCNSCNSAKCASLSKEYIQTWMIV